MEKTKRFLKLTCIFLVAAASVNLFLPTGVWSQDKTGASGVQGAAQVKKAYSLLKAEDYKGALEKSEGAIAVNPDLPDAWFLKGFALNRLGRFKEALKSLERARDLGISGPPLDYETGWAALFAGDWDRAVQHLEQYESAKPGSGGVSVSLGLALLGQGRLDDAEARLREAIERDPSKKPSALFLLAKIESARGDLPAARKHIQQLMVETPNSRLGRTLWGGLMMKEMQQAQAETGAPRKPWHVTLSTSGGHNNNVIALGDGLPLPIDVSSKSSPFAQVVLSARYEHLLPPDSSLTFGYSFNSNVYTNVDEFDSLDHYFYVRYAKQLRPDLVAFLTTSEQFTMIDSQRFRSEFSLRPSFLYRMNESASMEFSYRYASSDYLTLTAPVLDRDAGSHTFGVTGYFKFPDTDISLATGYFYLVNDTEGANFEFKGNGLSLSVSSLLNWKVRGEVNYTLTFNEYDNPDVFAPNGAARSDEIDRLTLRLIRPLWKMVSGFVRYDYINNDSNVPLFNYDQTMGSAGLVAEF